MPYFAVASKPNDNRKFLCVTTGENSTDAVITAYERWCGPDRFQEQLEEAESYNVLAERVLAELFDCTEIHRAMVLEYVERRLDGADITIIL